MIAYHGWGFDAHCWDPYTSEIAASGLDIQFHRADRGYSGREQSFSFDESDSINVVMAHSYGLHWCPSEQLQAADILIVIGGFLQFHPQTSQFRRRSKRMISRMIEQMHSNPEQVLDRFIENCYLPEPVKERPQWEKMNLMKLIEDLGRLNQSSLDADLLKKIPKLCILHGSKDRIVSKTKAREIYNRVYSSSRYLEVKEAGHAVPFTQPKRCWSFIEPELAAV
ncbi:MAG: alpha/beta fold hydrolase [Bacteroidota bacterium]